MNSCSASLSSTNDSHPPHQRSFSLRSRSRFCWLLPWTVDDALLLSVLRSLSLSIYLSLYHSFQIDGSARLDADKSNFLSVSIVAHLHRIALLYLTSFLLPSSTIYCSISSVGFEQLLECYVSKLHPWFGTSWLTVSLLNRVNLEVVWRQSATA